MKAVVERRGCTLEFDDATRQHVVEAAQWLVDPNKTSCLALMGLSGNGKTTLAIAIRWLVEYVTEIELGFIHRREVKFYTAKDICRLCAAGEKSLEKLSEYEKLSSDSMLIIDDLGEEPKEVLVYGMVHTPIIDILSHRYQSQRLTIITTNLDADSLKTRYGVRIADRFREMITPIAFENDSYRTRKTANQVGHTRS